MWNTIEKQVVKKETETPEEPESGSWNIFLLIIVISFKTKIVPRDYFNKFHKLKHFFVITVIGFKPKELSLYKY